MSNIEHGLAKALSGLIECPSCGVAIWPTTGMDLCLDEFLIEVSCCGRTARATVSGRHARCQEPEDVATGLRAQLMARLHAAHEEVITVPGAYSVTLSDYGDAATGTVTIYRSDLPSFVLTRSPHLAQSDVPWGLLVEDAAADVFAAIDADRAKWVSDNLARPEEPTAQAILRNKPPATYKSRSIGIRLRCPAASCEGTEATVFYGVPQAEGGDVLWCSECGVYRTREEYEDADHARRHG